MATGPWIQPNDTAIGFTPQQAIWQWGMTTPRYTSSPQTPAALFATTPDESAMTVGTPVAYANEFRHNATLLPGQEHRSRGRMAVWQYGNTDGRRPDHHRYTPPAWEWPEGATIEYEGPGTYLGPTTVDAVWSVSGTLATTQEVTLPTKGLLLEAPGVPFLTLGNVAANRPTPGQVLSYTVRDEVDAGTALPGGQVTWSSTAVFTTDHWPITLMTATTAERTGAFPHTGSMTSGDARVVTQLPSIYCYAPYRPPRYRFVTGAQGMWLLRQQQSLAGSSSWPLRQRQNGGHSGSWPLRQRQRRL